MLCDQQGGVLAVLQEIEDAIQLIAGDFLQLPGGKAFRLSSSPEVPIDAMHFFLPVPAGDNAVLNGARRCASLGGYFGFEEMHVERPLIAERLA